MPLENIYPTDFFAINNPDAPLVNIQFRTSVVETGDITNPDLWESITFDPSNYFNDLRIEDQGGAQQLTMNLQDTNFARLENIIIRAQLATRFANKLIQTGPKAGDPAEYLQFFISHANSANLRIRIGYSEFGNDENYIDAAEKLESEWQDRTNSRKPVIRSPWLYFQMSGAQFRYTETAMKVEVKGFSVGGSFLDQAKMVRQFAKLQGNPKTILERIEEIVQEAAQSSAVGDSQESIDFEFLGDDEPIGYPDESGGNSIEIMLGSESDAPRRTEVEGGGIYRSSPSYKSLKQVLNEICDKVRPLIYDRGGNKIIQNEDGSADGINGDNQLIDKVVKYGYSIVEEGNKTRVLFYYRDPNEQAKKQQLVRTYVWNEHGQSIVKQLNAETKTDFAALNLQLITVDEDTGEATLNIASPHPVDDEQQDSEVDYTIGNINNVSEALSSPDFSAMFVRDIKTPEAYQGSSFRNNAGAAANMLARMVVENLNNTVFTGKLSIPGDPFFIFDGNVTPFTYLIKVIAKRPSYIDETGIRTEGGISYVSGLYIIKKINHQVSGSGFTTELEIMKWPRKGETL